MKTMDKLTSTIEPAAHTLPGRYRRFHPGHGVRTELHTRRNVASLLAIAGLVVLGSSTAVQAAPPSYDISVIGPTDDEHTDGGGYRNSGVTSLNEAGQVAGSADRYNGGSTSLGRSAFLYDPVFGTLEIDNGTTRADGYAYTRPYALTADGIVVGEYDLYDTLGALLGKRAFYFDASDGFFDLGGLVDGDLGDFGWQSLASAVAANDFGFIAGAGLRTDMTSGQVAYLLTPQPVPVPPALWLLWSALAGLVTVRRTPVGRAGAAG